MSGNNGVPQKQGKNRGGIPPVEHRFKKGQSGNPGGRPKGTTLLSAIRELLDKGDGKDREAAAKAFVTALKRGSYNHAKELIEREEGKLPEDAHVRVLIEYADAQPNDPADDETAARRAAASN